MSGLRTCTNAGALRVWGGSKPSAYRLIKEQALYSTKAVAVPGGSLADVDTPALLVDLDAFEANCKRLRKTMQQWPNVSIRPHVKAHKCAEIARRQLSLLGATGVCAQKVSEAEAMAEGGITDILVSNQVVAPRKVQRLVGLAAAGANISVCVDSREGVEVLAQEASRRGASVGVLVEVNVGQNRCGVDTPAEAVRLASAVAASGLQLRGIQAYHGGQQHVRDPKERAKKVAESSARAAAAVAAIRAAGLPCPVVTGGGTGTYRLEAASGVYTEVQPGSFCFGDADYAKNLQEEDMGGPKASGSTARRGAGEWDQSLWVLTQVMSRNTERALVVVDAGTKAVSLDSGPPILPPSYTSGVQVEFQNGGDEHGKLLWPLGVYQMGPPELPAVGTLLCLQPGHCDPTVNLYDEIVAYRGSTVVGVWQIGARGPGL